MTNCPNARTCHSFDDTALLAAEFHHSLAPDVRIHHDEHDPEGQDLAKPGSVPAIPFSLAGTPCQALIGGPQLTFREAVLISVSTDNRPELDRPRLALIAAGIPEGLCGRLKDRFGLSWRIVPNWCLPENLQPIEIV